MSYLLEHKTDKIISCGSDVSLGATLIEGGGVNFSIYSQYAKEAYLLLFNAPEAEPEDIIKIENKTKDIWHVSIKGIKAGQLYGYKVKGGLSLRK